MSRDPAPPTPTLSQLRALIAVAQAGSFGEAAAELGVSQSSLSEAVGRLEAMTGRPLLRRTPGGTVATAAGERVLAHARAAVQAAGDVLLAAQDSGELSGTLRVAAYRSVATHLLPPALATFRRAHPGVRTVLLDGDTEETDAELALRTGRADAAVVVQGHTPGLHLTPLVYDEYLFVAPAARGDHPATLEELSGQTLFLPPGRDQCHRLVRQYLEREGVSLSGLTENPQDSVILSMVAHGLGVTILPRLALHPLPGGLVSLPLPGGLSRPLALAVLPWRAHLPLLRAFTDTLTRTLAARVPGGPPTPPPGAWPPALH
ncbi:LysR family transcriptional regulator [Deinococcus gobiensis]|uniref:Transcriptional regulator, LysR family n=1 Tax=Deinococcus gobiensis (strain DSM 21396 / JCM 16679 / CGMCC 1.7299 / I-0) TaxID=745776 RepID=H8GTE9_DEIGI|nr:LysR family transcriptional regulator [Deinococcus gobiensis]AFD24099.1 Transcriptional regulator, LysR family [Deinococcus gobiensis I-0]